MGTYAGFEMENSSYLIALFDSASRYFSLTWLLAFTKSFAWFVSGVVGLFSLGGVNKLTATHMIS